MAKLVNIADFASQPNLTEPVDCQDLKKICGPEKHIFETAYFDIPSEPPDLALSEEVAATIRLVILFEQTKIGALMYFFGGPDLGLVTVDKLGEDSPNDLIRKMLRTKESWSAEGYPARTENPSISVFTKNGEKLPEQQLEWIVADTKRSL